MEQIQHPVLNKDFIEKRYAVIEDVYHIPVEDNPLQSELMVIGLCVSGKASFDYNMQPKQFVPHELAVTLPNTLITYSATSPDYHSILVIVSKPFYDELIHRTSFIDYKKYYYRPSCRLNEQQFGKIQDVLRVLKMVCDSDHPKRKETLENIFDLLFYTLTRYRGEEDTRSETEMRYEQLFNRFYDLLTVHYAAHHDISWYAGQLALTPKYFSNVIRQTTDKSAAEWIDIVLITQAKKLLRTRRELTIQQIAYELGFRENAAFCNFFKSHTGLRPKAYQQS